MKKLGWKKLKILEKKHPYNGNDQRRMNVDDYKRIDMRRKASNYDGDVVTKLLELHPIGSNVYDAIKIIEGAGSKCHYYASDSSKKRLSKLPKNGRCRCYYKEPGIIFPTDWRVFIEVDNEIKIKRISGVVYKTPL